MWGHFHHNFRLLDIKKHYPTLQKVYRALFIVKNDHGKFHEHLYDRFWEKLVLVKFEWKISLFRPHSQLFGIKNSLPDVIQFSVILQCQTIRWCFNKFRYTVIFTSLQKVYREFFVADKNRRKFQEILFCGFWQNLMFADFGSKIAFFLAFNCLGPKNYTPDAIGDKWRIILLYSIIPGQFGIF